MDGKPRESIARAALTLASAHAKTSEINPE